MQRTNISPEQGVRSFIVFSLIVVAALWLVVLPFILDATDPPGWLLLAGRWIPALASLVVVLWLVPLRVRIPELWGLRVRSWSRTLVWAGFAFAAVLVAQLVQVAVGLPLGLARWAPTEGWLLAVVGSVIPITLVTMLSTLGEEVAWRGHLAQALAHLGFWRSTILIGLVWMVWHLPLVVAYAVADVMPLAANLAANLGIAFLAPLLAAVAIRGGSIWPAVVAHAVPPFSGVLVTDASPWFHVLFVAAMLMFGIALAPRTRARAERERAAAI
ncbi:hypothetical protein LKO27_10295 [Tessaracoccus sp. OS52]|uniref:CPBP family glutamic-type intramembrane protease n=1 Tax=Tessaracoccus sp. OS52 TaxID=2886691 RepID=UPI001D124ADC|nr:CPBP family glutamic-type intramembrane protease [Tessaracoccus sp. OS52]MCC2593794.1 hypothetical protein [Tessaracoccus sp. OS52]